MEKTLEEQLLDGVKDIFLKYLKDVGEEVKKDDQWTETEKITILSFLNVEILKVEESKED